MGGVSKDLTVNQEWVKKRFEKCDDILKRQVFLGEGRQEGYLVYVEVTVSNLMLEEHVIGLSDVQPLDGYEQAEAALLAGNGILFLEGDDTVYKISSKGYPGIGVSKAESEKERMRANLLRAVSHDLRTPLTTIYSASSTLLDKREQLTDQQRDLMLKSIQEDSEWLVRMVENLLSITRIGSERIEIAKTPVILDELIDSAMTKFHSRYPGQEVALELPEDMVAIPVDAILIEQVLINLLENAVLHAEGMTTLSLRVFTLGRQAIFEVADNGCGIREDRLSHIFSGSYEALESTPDGRKRNAGIGLSVCATIIKAHGGEITAENRRGGGALFRFTLGKEDITDDE